MSESDLFSVYFESINIAQANFEFWLTATFAYTLAFHFTGNEMSVYFRRMLQILYILAVIVFVVNWLNAAMLALSMVEQIESGNPEITVRPLGGATVSPILIILLMLFGSIGAIHFSTKASRKSGERET